MTNKGDWLLVAPSGKSIRGNLAKIHAITKELVARLPYRTTHRGDPKRKRK